MQFYGYQWDQMMLLPLRLFWTLVKSMHRIKAAENMRLITITGFPNLAENTKREYIADQEKTLGTIAISDERDHEGIDKLKSLGG